MGMPAPREPETDNIVRILDLKGGENKGAYRVFEKLQPGGNKPPFANASNCTIILLYDPPVAGIFGFNEFHGKPMLLRPVPKIEDKDEPQPGPYPRVPTDSDMAILLTYIQGTWCAKMTDRALESAMKAAAARNRFHPVKKWLDGIEWDGTSRVSGWLNVAFGAPDDEYTKAVAVKWLVAAVRRIREPGCKFDYLLILEGKQGIRKSSSCEALAGPEWFTDNLHPDLSSRDAPISMAGKWILEMGEIEHLIRSDNNVFKSFMSRRVDRFRGINGKDALDVPRQCVLIGTTNQESYLRDETGNRRIWPVKCTRADVDWITENREQLWAEAAELEASGMSIFLDAEEANVIAAKEQDDRMVYDPWTDKVFNHIGLLTKITVTEILTNGLQLSFKDVNRATEMRVAAILRSNGWTKKQERHEGIKAQWWSKSEA